MCLSGFSRQLVGILGELETDYGSFDILEDAGVRAGLKEFSNWPTFPQLYVDGQLLGGLDIIKEMKESGELKDALPRKVPLKERLDRKKYWEHGVFEWFTGSF